MRQKELSSKNFQPTAINVYVNEIEHDKHHQGRIERRGHATHTNIEIFIVTKNIFYAHADVTSRKVH